jgi:hypothetical protein
MKKRIQSAETRSISQKSRHTPQNPHVIHVVEENRTRNTHLARLIASSSTTSHTKPRPSDVEVKSRTPSRSPSKKSENFG